jgi:putrescine aminotransferase
VAGVSLGGMGFMQAQGGVIPGVEHVMQPYQFAEGFGEDEDAFAARAAAAIEERILAVGPEMWPPSSANRCRARAAW